MQRFALTFMRHPFALIVGILLHLAGATAPAPAYHQNRRPGARRCTSPATPSTVSGHHSCGAKPKALMAPAASATSGYQRGASSSGRAGGSVGEAGIGLLDSRWGGRRPLRIAMMAARPQIVMLEIVMKAQWLRAPALVGCSAGRHSPP